MDVNSFLNHNEYFISDLGPLVPDPNSPVHTQRFAVWRNAAAQKQLQLVEVGSSLSDLQEKYHVPQERVAVVGV